jgi:hypothetical protein
MGFFVYQVHPHASGELLFGHLDNNGPVFNTPA